MKRIFKIVIISLLTIFSFYYTDVTINFIKDKDPIMVKIKESKELEPVNGVILDDEFLVGLSGEKINYKESYNNMKSFNVFNEEFLVYEKVKPEINKKSNLDKVIIGKNTDSKEISFIFYIDNLDTLKELNYIVNKNNIEVTYFFSNYLLEKNFLEIKKVIGNNYIGYVNDNNDFLYSKSIIKKYFSKNIANYCLYKDKLFLKTCILNKINTIKPIIIDDSIFDYLKRKKNNGMIYQIKLNKYNIKELNSSFIYLKQKGFKILSINDLLKE